MYCINCINEIFRAQLKKKFSYSCGARFTMSACISLLNIRNKVSSLFCFPKRGNIPSGINERG